MKIVVHGRFAPVTGGAGRLIKNTFSLEEIHEAIETAANGDALKVMVTM